MSNTTYSTELQSSTEIKTQNIGKQEELNTTTKPLLRCSTCKPTCQTLVSVCPEQLSCGKRDITNEICGCSAYNVRAACEYKIAQKAELLNPIAKGEINGKFGSVLRDTGATCIVVKEAFVEAHQYTGEQEPCILIDGTTKCFPVAIIHLNTPYFHGTSKAVVMQNPLHDVIIGNVINSNVDFKSATTLKQTKMSENSIILEPVKMQPPVENTFKQLAQIDISPNTSTFLPFSQFLTQELKEKPVIKPKVTIEVAESISSAETSELQAVVTRSMQAKSSRPIKPLKTPTFPDLDLSVEEVKQLQKTDKSLKKLWEKVDKQPLMVLKPYQHTFYVKKDLLYRKFTTPNIQVSNTINQLVVPEKLRLKVMEISHSSILCAHMGCTKTLSRIMTKFYCQEYNPSLRDTFFLATFVSALSTKDLCPRLR